MVFFLELQESKSHIFNPAHLGAADFYSQNMSEWFSVGPTSGNKGVEFIARLIIFLLFCFIFFGFTFYLNSWMQWKIENLREAWQTKIHNIGATLVGVDKFGNKYYEKLENVQYGRHRWVEYGEKTRYNASQVPPEWHGWLHYITDHTGDELLMLKPQRYGVDHKQNFSGEGDEYIYHSKGHALNPGQKDWTRYQKWKPTQP